MFRRIAWPESWKSAPLLATLLTLPACSGGGGPTGGTPHEAVASVTVDNPSPTLTVGQTSLLTATPRSGTGASLAGRPIQWSSSPATVASVSSAGLVTALTPGT